MRVLRLEIPTGLGAWLLLGASIVGCPAPAPVPFKNEDAPPPTGGPLAAPTPPPEPDHNAAALPKSESRRHDGGEVVELPGGELALPGAVVSLSLDLDDDDQLDALVWAEDTEGGYALWRSLGGEGGYGPPHQVDRSRWTLPTADPPCQVSDAALSVIGGTKGALQVRLDCPLEAADAPRELLWVMSLGSSPRILERFGLRLGAHQAPLELAEVRAQDEDGDGHADLRLSLRSSAAATDVTLTWLDRPSGLARDTREPEASLGALASGAEQAMARGKVDDASREAERVLDVHAQLCREGGRPQLSVAGSWGLRCGDSSAVGHAALTAIRARAARGEVLAAFEALVALDREGGKVDAKARTAALKALDEAAETRDYSLAPVAAVGLPAQAALPPRVRLAQGVLWAGSEPARIWDPATRDELPSLDAPSLPLSFSDPSGRYRVQHIDRDCEGRLLRLSGTDGSTVRVRVREQPRDETCSMRLPVPDAGDLRVLGWAPQGVVLADREGALLVPLDARARATDPPRRLAASTPLPAPLPEGRAAPGGQCYVLPSPHGVLLRRQGRAESERLIRPPGWAELEGDVREAAVDRDCQRIAIATSSRVYLILPASEGSAAP